MNTVKNNEDLRTPGDELRPGGEARQITLQKNRIDSGDLFVETREIVIAHGDEIYRLRVTAQNKLILTK